MIDGKNVFDHQVKNNKVTYENFRKTAAGQGDYYTTSCLLDYTYFKKCQKMIAVDLSKQQVLDADLNQSNKLILQQTQIQQEELEFISFLKKPKKLCLSFRKEL